MFCEKESNTIVSALTRKSLLYKMIFEIVRQRAISGWGTGRGAFGRTQTLFPLTETESVNCISIYYSIVSP